jgi:hypothetical protein
MPRAPIHAGLAAAVDPPQQSNLVVGQRRALRHDLYLLAAGVAPGPSRAGAALAWGSGCAGS